MNVGVFTKVCMIFFNTEAKVCMLFFSKKVNGCTPFKIFSFNKNVKKKKKYDHDCFLWRTESY